MRSQAQANIFCSMTAALYVSDPNYVQPLHRDVKEIFDPSINQNFATGAAKRWLLLHSGRAIGRIAAFFKHPSSSFSETLKPAGIGFFECINSQLAADLLFSEAESWLLAQGFNAIDGPINFGERDRWWGLLTDGQGMPSYGCNHHLKYYKALFQSAGYQPLYEQFTFGREVQTPLPSLVKAKADRIFANQAYSFKHIQKKDLNTFAEDFATVYSEAWINHAGRPQITPAKAYSLAKELSPILDESLIWFAYHKGSPVAFVLALPDINFHLSALNGRFGPWQMLRFALHRWLSPSNKIVGQAFGIVPSHQNRGLEGALVVKLDQAIQNQNERTRHHYQWMEMNWIGSFNPVMIKMTKQLGAEVVKTHVTYRKILDKNITWQPYPVLS